MRYFLFMALLFFASVWGYSQEKRCYFPRKSITRPDSLQTVELVKTITALPLKSYHEVDKIPAFIKEAFLCWNDKWTIVNPGREPAFFKIDSVPSFTGLAQHPDTTITYAVSLITKEDSFSPERQLMYLGLNEEYMLIAYIGNNTCWQYCPVMLFRFKNKKIISVKYWRSSSEEIKTKEDVIKYLRSYDDLILLLTI